MIPQKVKGEKNLTKQVVVNGKNITGRARVCELDKTRFNSLKSLSIFWVAFEGRYWEQSGLASRISTLLHMYSRNVSFLYSCDSAIISRI